MHLKIPRLIGLGLLRRRRAEPGLPALVLLRRNRGSFLDFASLAAASLRHCGCPAHAASCVLIIVCQLLSGQDALPRFLLRDRGRGSGSDSIAMHNDVDNGRDLS